MIHIFDLLMDIFGLVMHIYGLVVDMVMLIFRSRDLALESTNQMIDLPSLNFTLLNMSVNNY